MSRPAGAIWRAQSSYQVHNDELAQVSDTEIRAIWSMEDCVIFPEADAGATRPARHHGYGHYHETWVLEDGAWLIDAGPSNRCARRRQAGSVAGNGTVLSSGAVAPLIPPGQAHGIPCFRPFFDHSFQNGAFP